MPPKLQSHKRLVYFGTPQEAVKPLLALVEAGAKSSYEIVLVVTGQDKPRGRGQKMSPTPVKAKAKELDIEVSHNPADAVAQEADLGIVVAYGQLLKQDVLSAMPLVNLHFSLLPRWRGAAPVERAILSGDQNTGVCLMAIEPTLDTGPIYASAKTPITAIDTTQSLKNRLCDLGIELLLEILKSDLPVPTPQEGEPTWAKKIKSTDLEIDLSLSSQELSRRVRVGGAWMQVGKRRLKVQEVTIDASPPKLPIGEFYETESLDAASSLNPKSSEDTIISQDSIPEDTTTQDAGPQDTTTQDTTTQDATTQDAGPLGKTAALGLVVLDGGLILNQVQPEGKKAMKGIDWFRGYRGS